MNNSTQINDDKKTQVLNVDRERELHIFMKNPGYL